ncbi:MAG: CTP synthase [Opitutaceae bacterium]|jgi:CTP synthase
MPSGKSIALIGDYNPQVTAHQAIPGALRLAREAVGTRFTWDWIGTNRISDASAALAGFSGVWVVPASPYRNAEGVLAVIRYARENKIPFLGTCGGFQHALIEFARNVVGIPAADHAETNAHGTELVVTRLACSLAEKTGTVKFMPGSRMYDIFGGQPASEGYHCSYGLNEAYRSRMEAAGLIFTGFDEAGEVRAAELPTHPFYFGTLFQPERSSLREVPHPLIEAFVESVI